MTGTRANEPGSPGEQVLPGQSRLQAALPPGSLVNLPGVVVGIDLVEIERIAQTVARFGERFLQRIFSEAELQESRRRITWLAGRFAAKEACAKALGAGIGEQAAWRDMQILRQPNGKPTLHLLGDAAARAAALGLGPLDVSITHTHHYALAVVVGLSTS
jgi:holo-[acyl-carrier protein] synthase